MTTDQKIQIWVAIGTWLSAIGTLAAVVVALYLSLHTKRIKLRLRAGRYEIILGNGLRTEKVVSFEVVNLGDRNVTIVSGGWAVGKGEKRKYCIQPVSGMNTSQYPIELAHGKSAHFMVSLMAAPTWFKHLALDFIEDLSDENLGTLVAQVHTSIGETVEAKPAKAILDELKKYRTDESEDKS